MPKRSKSNILMGELSKKKHAGNSASTAVRVSLDADMRAWTLNHELLLPLQVRKYFYARYNLFKHLFLCYNRYREKRLS